MFLRDNILELQLQLIVLDQLWHLVREDVVVRLRREQILVPNRLGKGYRKETACTVNWVTDGQDRCHVGFLPRAYVAQGGLFDGVLCQVVSIGNTFDDDHKK